ncbi:hypothetical protein [Nocardioides hungaricus]
MGTTLSWSSCPTDSARPPTAVVVARLTVLIALLVALTLLPAVLGMLRSEDSRV